LAKSFFCTVAILVALASSLQAGNLASACLAGTLAQYEALTPSGNFNVPFECSVGILNYTYFSSSTNLNAADVEVTPVTGLNGLAGGFALSPIGSVVGTPNDPFNVAAGTSVTYDLDWFFIIDSGPVASGASIGLDPPFGDVTITQNYCTDSFFENVGNTLECFTPPTAGPPSSFISSPQTLQVTTLGNSCEVSCSDTILFNPPALSFASVDTEISLTGVAGTQGSGFDEETALPTIIPPPSVPEPVTSLLALGGFLALCLMRSVLRRRRV